MIFITFLMLLIWAGFISTTYFTLVYGLAIVYYILYALGAYSMFKKANITGWYAFIPLLNEYEVYKLAWNGSCYLPYFVCATLGNMFEKSSGFKKFLGHICAAVAVVFELLVTNKLAKAFGKGTAFGLGLFFFKPIFVMILGLGSSIYLGPQD